jgi:hypothetical protein
LRFYTEEECERWLNGLQRSKPRAETGINTQRIGYPPHPHRIFWFAQWMASSITYRLPTLLWFTEWGIWSSNENLHLYYKLRQAYGDNRLLDEAPGHLFLAHESEDLASFLQIGMLNGWDGYVLTQAGYVDAFFSHDEFIDFFATEKKRAG